MRRSPVRVIKGLRLRVELDNEPTIEEILEVNNQVDNKGDRGGPNPGDSQGDSPSDSLKSPSDKGNGKGSNSELTNRESKIDLDSVGDNVSTVTEELEIKTEITVDKSSQAANPETIVSELLVEAVSKVVPSEIDWVSYPYNSGGAAGNSFADTVGESNHFKLQE